ncbi:tyrosine-type recombinase/integrase [Flavobacterium capsici]|uniref:Tyrosine-type recombinase/integrase n=1 Tax=Flavobacterium capsici TaxID=3075618 RepID=A0AA96EX94_9FLAO|nr:MULTISPECIES: tyrosine-type recombinase/integrase [unclassified Flavobacterium]WNM18535.1 tyrosine-type recombinase/integrase [Flavobacterium sp. PMR2A8]WNM22586.1 tyrosine-type recombinase/integrase [Flavobacterium sp. PMTSA4]
MRSTFNLKEPNKDKESLILFSAYFKMEGRKFVYSTGEMIHPDDWDFENRQPKNLNGRTESANRLRGINRQLERYSNFFSDLIQKYKLSNRDISIADIKDDFDIEFKRTTAISSKFFEVYDLFLTERKSDFTDEANSETTIKRYEYNKKLLFDFQTFNGKKINFNQIDKVFYNSFIEFSISEKKHSANTVRRNVGLLKTFLYWATENNHTYKIDYQKFKSPKSQLTDEVALTLEQVQEVFEFDFSNNERLERVRDLFVFGCATGMRISNYSNVQEKDIQDGFIKVRDKKNTDKALEIPLNDFSIFLLKKYEYKLPNISNQKFNDYIKEVFQTIGYNQNIKKTVKVGKDIIEQVNPLFERISSHTARRSFITIMKNNKIPDKVIMSYTGHRSLEVFNKYYKPNNDDKKEFMKSVWKMENAQLKKVD